LAQATKIASRFHSLSIPHTPGVLLQIEWLNTKRRLYLDEHDSECTPRNHTLLTGTKRRAFLGAPVGASED
jgi:hypothetical protein